MIKYHPQQELLSLHIKGELPLSMSLAISAHAELCSICQQKLNALTESETVNVLTMMLSQISVLISTHRCQPC